MRKPITQRRTKPPTCKWCDEPLETAATAQNPSATIRANSLARCPSCMVLFVIGAIYWFGFKRREVLGSASAPQVDVAD